MENEVSFITFDKLGIQFIFQKARIESEVTPGMMSVALML